MKITILSLALVLSAVVSAAPATQAAPELVVRDVDCSYCTGMLNFCFEVSSRTPGLTRHCDTKTMQNGHSRGQEGCKQTCREHVCHRAPGVRTRYLEYISVLTCR